MYPWLKLLHIAAAVIAVGTNVTYFFWLSRIRREPAPAAGILQGIRDLDARIANPAYVVLPLTGILMVLFEDIGFSTFWIWAAIVLYVTVAVVGGAFFSPSLRRQVALAESTEPGTKDYAAAAKRTVATGIATMVPVAAILYLMVLKPTPSGT